MSNWKAKLRKRHALQISPLAIREYSPKLRREFEIEFPSSQEETILQVAEAHCKGENKAHFKNSEFTLSDDERANG